MAKKKESRDNYSFNNKSLVNKWCGSTNDQSAEEDSRDKLTYCVTDVPPWHLCIILGIQHFLTAFGGIIAIPLILSQGLCLQHDGLTQSHLISTIFFVSGICTVLQVTLGIRLPILQGGTFTFLAPTTSLLSMPDLVCPAWTQNATLVNTSSPEFIQVWQSRLQLIQGSIMVGSLFQMLVGFSGLIGLFMRFIGPLTIAPTICLIGLSLFDSAGREAGSHWGISAIKTKKFHVSKINIFQILPVLMGLTVSWLICYLLTIFNALPSDPKQYGYLARTDIKGDVIGAAPWFRFPYPGQWGLPTVSVAGVLGILAGVITSMVESVGDYYACAKLSGAPPPPKHAINRAIGIEGLGCLLAGAWGTGNGTTSYSIVELDQVLQALLTTHMFVGGFCGFVLDNTVPGTKHERGMIMWNWAQKESESDNIVESEEVYGLPCGISSRLASYPWVRYIPFCSSYKTRPENDTTSNSISLVKKEPSENNTNVIVTVAL
ncbi:Solute carrier family 23 member 1 [Bagarius yarrelli]|uniref:Solute carrier family 23 member 1 n=1 Tax=Bagarius yarrelli TaxID=175774 RepID=A0A556TQR7_BAGYA|nr:Solute carrier family 23 member 1 [Bagarius yarrelli]